MTWTKDPRVDDYIDALPAWQQDVCHQVRRLVHDVDPEVEETINASLTKAGITGKAVPQLNVSFDELTKLDVGPKAGFLLSRLDGSFNIDSILKISPMDPLEAQLVILELVEGGQVRL